MFAYQFDPTPLHDHHAITLVLHHRFFFDFLLHHPHHCCLFYLVLLSIYQVVSVCMLPHVYVYTCTNVVFE